MIFFLHINFCSYFIFFFSFFVAFFFALRCRALMYKSIIAGILMLWHYNQPQIIKFLIAFTLLSVTVSCSDNYQQIWNFKCISSTLCATEWNNKLPSKQMQCCLFNGLRNHNFLLYCIVLLLSFLLAILSQPDLLINHVGLVGVKELSSHRLLCPHT